MLGYSFVPTRELDDLRRRAGITDVIEHTAVHLDIIRALVAALGEAAQRPGCSCASRPTPTPPPAPASALSPEVLVACRQYSGGDKREEYANQRVALSLHRQGKQDREIVAAIARGLHGGLRGGALALAADPPADPVGGDEDPDEHTFRVPPRGRSGDEMAVVA